MKKLVASLILIIGLMGIGVADIDIPPETEPAGRVDITADAGWESDSPPPSGEIVKEPSVEQKNQACNCTIIIVVFTA